MNQRQSTDASPTSALGVVSRRAFLTLGSAATALSLLGETSSGHILSASASEELTAYNGWSLSPLVQTQRVEGTDSVVDLLPGDVSTVLRYVIRRYHYEIVELRQDQIKGFQLADRNVAPSDYRLSNMAGIAVTIREVEFPYGASDGLYPNERNVVDDILRKCRGVVEWSGNLLPAQESHFHINVAPGDPRLNALATEFRERDATPGSSSIDISSTKSSTLQ